MKLLTALLSSLLPAILAAANPAETPTSTDTTTTTTSTISTTSTLTTTSTISLSTETPTTTTTTVSTASSTSTETETPTGVLVGFNIQGLRASTAYRATSATVSFTFVDLNTNCTARCNATFVTNVVNTTSPVTSDYRPCGDWTSGFRWRFNAFEGIDDFELELSRTFRTPMYVLTLSLSPLLVLYYLLSVIRLADTRDTHSVGDPPQDWVTLFGVIEIKEGDTHVCSASRAWGQVCQSPQGTVLPVPINAAVAKK